MLYHISPSGFCSWGINRQYPTENDRVHKYYPKPTGTTDHNSPEPSSSKTSIKTILHASFYSVKYFCPLELASPSINQKTFHRAFNFPKVITLSRLFRREKAQQCEQIALLPASQGCAFRGGLS